MSELQTLVTQLQTALGVSVACGQITLNVNGGVLQSVETKVFTRVASKVIDKRSRVRV